MDDPNNPYLSPNWSDPILTPLEGADPRTVGKAAQVRTVAILMIAHSILMLIGGCILFGMAYYMAPQIAQQIKLQQQQTPRHRKSRPKQCRI